MPATEYRVRALHVAFPGDYHEEWDILALCSDGHTRHSDFTYYTRDAADLALVEFIRNPADDLDSWFVVENKYLN